MNPGRKMVGADGSTELWRPPNFLKLLHFEYFAPNVGTVPHGILRTEQNNTKAADLPLHSFAYLLASENV